MTTPTKVAALLGPGDHIARIPAFREAPEDALTAFAAANESVWAAIAEQSPDPWTVGVHTAARTWASYRVHGRA